MKKVYVKPCVNFNVEKPAIPPAPLALAAGALAGYAAGRSVVNAVKAQPVLKVERILEK